MRDGGMELMLKAQLDRLASANSDPGYPYPIIEGPLTVGTIGTLRTEAIKPIRQLEDRSQLISFAHGAGRQVAVLEGCLARVTDDKAAISVEGMVEVVSQRAAEIDGERYVMYVIRPFYASLYIDNR